jgi:hypothetical protein
MNNTEITIMGRAVIPKELKETLTAENNNHSRVYSTMHPVQSPYFAKWQEVCDWFNEQPYFVKAKFIDTNSMCIYVHGIDLIGREKFINGSVYYTTIEGEVIATDEAFIWDFTLNKFI